MNLHRPHAILWLALFLAAATGAQAQQALPAPHVGYVYPAGARQGAEVEITVGGQFLDGVSQVYVSGQGVEATVVKHTKPLTQRQINELREKLEKARDKMQAEGQTGAVLRPGARFAELRRIVNEMGVTDEELKALDDFRKQRTDPKRQLNPQIAETVTLRVKLAPDAEPGERELRLLAGAGLTNPLRFQVGPLPEYCENEPNDTTPDTGLRRPLPVVLNGQILPGDVDRFSFQAHKGERLVVAAAARELIPYLADAVPGWFQATLTLYDAKGNEVAYDDDYRFDPDPVLFYEIPAEGEYVLQIADAVYRGRQDFVYRITLGEVPFVTSIFPLGGREGDPATVDVKGWNLPVQSLTLRPDETTPGIHAVSVKAAERASNSVPFAVDELPERLEKEPNDETPGAQRVVTPLVVNGRIDRPGDWDVFRFEGRAGDEIVAEVQARRLGSPLDSVLELTDAHGRQLAVNDDHEDKGAGLTTHHADSRLCVTLPAHGDYYLRLGDTQHQGGEAYAYRLRIGPPQPDFELRVVPSSINVRAGATVPITVFALRRDGFSDDISLDLVDAPPGFTLSGGWVPAGADQVRLTLTAPPFGREEPVTLHLEGRAVIGGREIRRPAVAADDMMQAFIYRHLVPASDLMVAVIGRGRFRTTLKLVEQTPVKLPADGTARVRVSLPSGPLMGQVQLALSDPPEGISIESVSPVREGAAIVFRADPAKVKPGLKGNLIVDAFVERTLGPGNGKPQANRRRFPLGSLPAIPFEIVKPEQ
jgi:hypothetical protein